MIPYKDLADEPEDERIRQIGERTMQGGIVAFVTDTDDGKMDRYLFKLFTLFPEIELVWRGDGPVANTVMAKVQRKI